MGGGQVVYTKKRNWNDQHTARININLATKPIRLKTLIKDINTYEPRCEKTSLRGFQPGPTQTRLYSHRRWLEA